MINLIPPAAKKGVVREYWLRVVSVWFYTWSAALLAGVLVMVPSYVLIQSQVSVYQESARTASEKVASFEDVSKNLTQSSQQAGRLVSGFRQSLVSDKISSIRALETSGIGISEINVDRVDETYAPVQISGSADSRQALAEFREQLLQHEEVASVDLPISNLAKDRDIQFTLSVVLKKNTP